ncbi:PQQ-binding-like beta-propeller repeat protein [Dactylosporangium salmoneum]|uniref:Pyrrolo-quinoline quinone repeat domain-containing protein n=1 Tax=Dactylosporangium salmoneum TaxID=53361 RepID=A0ABN3HJ99_9ACTN
MPDAIIELDISAPWEPAEPRKGPWRWRWAAPVAVLAVAAGLLTGSGTPPGLAPVYTADFQVLQVMAGGGRFVLARLQAGRIAIEALDARDGALLWRRPAGADESIMAVTGRTVVVQAERTEDNLEYTGEITALDAVSGQPRWTRAKARIDGLAPGLILAEDMDRPGGDERLVALDEGSGRVVWSADAPPGVVTSLAVAQYSQVRQLSELDGDGQLRVRDLRTGAVAATFRLQWSGAVGQHAPGAAGQELVWPAGSAGTEVYDRASGRRLWVWPGPGDGYPRLSACLPGRYCIFGDGGTDVLDAGTGEPRWRADGYSALLEADDRQMIMYRQVTDEFRPDDLAAFDASTGALRWRRTGWLLAADVSGAPRSPGYIVWRAAGGATAVVGRLDPRTGQVRAIGRAEWFAGSPLCAATADRLACLALGVVYVWRLP